MQAVYEPTVVAASPFDASADSQALRAAMKGFGTDEDVIIDILTHRSNAQRQQIAQVFKEELGRDLVDDLKSELGGRFEDVIVALMAPPMEYLANEIHRAMKGIGTDEDCLIETICSRNNQELIELRETYNRLHGVALDNAFKGEISGDFKRLLTLLVTAVRKEGVEPSLATEMAARLVEAGEGKLGTDEETFNDILAHQSFAQLELIFAEYKTLTGKTIEQALKSEISGELLDGLLAIVECCQNRVTYFTKKLHKSMEGFGTRDAALIRIIVSRSEIDLGAIKREFEKLYDRTLESAVKSETSGDYKKALLQLIGGP